MGQSKKIIHFQVKMTERQTDRQTDRHRRITLSVTRQIERYMYIKIYNIAVTITTLSLNQCIYLEIFLLVNRRLLGDQLNSDNGNQCKAEQVILGLKEGSTDAC